MTDDEYLGVQSNYDPSIPGTYNPPYTALGDLRGAYLDFKYTRIGLGAL